jgi:hypothetical protein
VVGADDLSDTAMATADAAGERKEVVAVVCRGRPAVRVGRLWPSVVAVGCGRDWLVAVVGCGHGWLAAVAGHCRCHGRGWQAMAAVG